MITVALFWSWEQLRDRCNANTNFSRALLFDWEWINTDSYKVNRQSGLVRVPEFQPVLSNPMYQFKRSETINNSDVRLSMKVEKQQLAQTSRLQNEELALRV